MPTKHRGERLAAFLKRTGVTYSQAAREVGVHRNTIHNWVESETLAVDNILKLVQVFPTLADAYPELQLEQENNLIQEPVESYTNLQDLSDACRKQIEHWKNKCIKLQEDKDRVMEKYIALLESQ
jgi:plasmid maintenance system antidote protein VapI